MNRQQAIGVIIGGIGTIVFGLVFLLRFHEPIDGILIIGCGLSFVAFAIYHGFFL
jgi:hypothetical protein